MVLAAVKVATTVTPAAAVNEEQMTDTKTIEDEESKVDNEDKETESNETSLCADDDGGSSEDTKENHVTIEMVDIVSTPSALSQQADKKNH